MAGRQINTAAGIISQGTCTLGTVYHSPAIHKQLVAWKICGNEQLEPREFPQHSKHMTDQRHHGKSGANEVNWRRILLCAVAGAVIY